MTRDDLFNTNAATVPLDGNVTLGPCKGQGYPPPNLQWSIADDINDIVTINY